MIEWVKYSSYGVPMSLPAGDTDSDGDFDSTDASAITGTYDVRKDVNLDGTVDVVDYLDALDLNGGLSTQGWSVLSNPKWNNRKGYAGYEGDTVLAGTKWHVRHRVLESELGRWMRRDPLGYVDGWNVYVAISNAGINKIDSFGLYGNSDFVFHYYHGDGEDVDLAKVGLLDAYRGHRAVAPLVTQFKLQTLSKAYGAARDLYNSLDCSCKSGMREGSSEMVYNRTYSISKWDFIEQPDIDWLSIVNTFHNFWNVDWTYSIGGHLLYASASCYLWASCNSNRYGWTCNLDYRINDLFADPLEIMDAWKAIRALFPQPEGMDVAIELIYPVGGTEFNIVGRWGDQEHSARQGHRPVPVCIAER
jgi:RHS repeat-associated protein